jgi:hypothetical protein
VSAETVSKRKSYRPGQMKPAARIATYTALVVFALIYILSSRARART